MPPTSLTPSAHGHGKFAGRTVAIVGSGQAGSQAAITLRERGFRGRVILLGDEPSLPYMRPPLSKAFLEGDEDEAHLLLRPPAFYDSQSIEWRSQARVTEIDRAAKTLHLTRGESLVYDKLILATGCRPRTLRVPGAQLPGIHAIRTIDDSARLRFALAPGRRVVIVGGGYLGLEVAAVAAKAGARVTVIEVADRLLSRVTTRPVSNYLEQVHRSHGVDVLCARQVTAFGGSDRLESVESDGQSIPADIAVVAIGAVPNDELARDAGLACDDGILVDLHARTADASIHAAGDCTRHPNPLYGRLLRLESVQNAIEQAEVAATNIAGTPMRYARVPWFWSQQFDQKLQSAGLVEGHDAIEERGDRGSGRFALRYLRGGELIAVDAINLPGEYLAARREIERRFAESGSTTPSLARQRVA